MTDKLEKIRKELISRYDFPKNCELIVDRTSKWVLVLKLVKGLAIFGKFKFNCRLGTMERLI